MNLGFVKCGVYTPKIKVADAVFNVESIISGILDADKKGVEVLCFPELCITGYTVGDLFFSDVLYKGVLNGIEKIAESTKGVKTLVFIGSPIQKDGLLFDSAIAIYNGEILGVVCKDCLNNYEKRYFNNAKENCTVNILNKEVPFGSGLVFNCDNGFSVAVSFDEGDFNSYNAEIVVNLSAIEEETLKDEKLLLKAKTLTDIKDCAVLFSNAGEGESTTDCVYSGFSFIAEGGEIISKSAPFTNGLTVADVDVGYIRYRKSKAKREIKDGYIINYKNDRREKIERSLVKFPFIDEKADSDFIIRMQAEGLKKRIEHTFSKKLIIGLSGGLDSTLALIVAVRAMDLLKRSRKDVIAITMPCFGTTSRTFENSVKLAKSLNAVLRKIDIGKSVNRHLKDISHKEGTLDAAFENAQARERTQILMDIANMENGMVVGTGDLSELALGFATYNGDHMSMYGVNASLPKTLIRKVVKDYALTNKGKVKAVLLDILDTPISPELLPTDEEETKQKTEDIVGPYVLHDFFLFNFIMRGYSPEKILTTAEITFKGEFDRETILKWLKIFFRRFFNQQFKRSCLPDGVKVSPISLSPRGAFTMPSDAVFALWQAELDGLEKNSKIN